YLPLSPPSGSDHDLWSGDPTPLPQGCLLSLDVGERTPAGANLARWPVRIHPESGRPARRSPHAAVGCRRATGATATQITLGPGARTNRTVACVTGCSCAEEYDESRTAQAFDGEASRRATVGPQAPPNHGETTSAAPGICAA